jgi:hypothetical protein
MISQIQVLSDSLHTNQAQVKRGLKSIQDSFSKTVCEIVKEHVTTCFWDNRVLFKTVLSCAITPAPHVQQLQTEQLIGQGQINAPFQPRLPHI